MPGLEAHPGVAGPLARPPAVAGPSGGVAAASGARTLLLWRVVFGFLGRLRSAEGGPQKLRSRDICERLHWRRTQYERWPMRTALESRPSLRLGPHFGIKLGLRYTMFTRSGESKQLAHARAGTRACRFGFDGSPSVLEEIVSIVAESQKLTEANLRASRGEDDKMWVKLWRVTSSPIPRSCAIPLQFTRQRARTSWLLRPPF